MLAPTWEAFTAGTAASSLWVPLTDAFPMSQGNYLGGESIAPDPTDANIVYAAAGMYLGSGNGVILRSTDQGSTWTVNDIPVAMGGNANGRGMGERLAVDPNNNAILLFGTRQNGLYKSTDSGTTWAAGDLLPDPGRRHLRPPRRRLRQDRRQRLGLDDDLRGGSDRRAPAVTSTRRPTAARPGRSWPGRPDRPHGCTTRRSEATGPSGWPTPATYGPDSGSRGTLVGRSGSTRRLERLVDQRDAARSQLGRHGGRDQRRRPERAARHRLYARLVRARSPPGDDDGGTTWSVIAQPPISGNANGSTYDVKARVLAVAGGADIGTGATNWVEAVALDPFNPNRAMYGTGAGVWSSTNIGAATGANGQGVTWTFLDQGLEETVPSSLMPTINGAFLGAIGDLGGMRNTNLDVYSTTGEYIESGRQPDCQHRLRRATNPNFVVRVGNSGKVASDVAYSNDNGLTWTPCATAAPGYTTASEMSSVAVAADGSGFVVAPVRDFGTPARTTNRGATWTASTGLPSGSLLAADRVIPGTFYATSAGMLYASTDGGVTFTTANTFTGSGTPRAVFGEAGEVWVAATGGLYRFTASGAKQTAVTTVTKATGVGFGMAAPGNTHPAVFIIGTVAGQYGFFRSDDGAGATWTRFNDDAHQFGALQGNYIAGDENVYGRVYLTTGGRGYVYYDLP